MENQTDNPDVVHDMGFLVPEEAAALFAQLKGELSFRPDSLRINGQVVETKRQIDYRGDADASYAYTGNDHAPAPWTPGLTIIKNKIEARLGLKFNAVLCNYYANGAVGMGWHADKEADLGTNPVIASVSLGAARLFRFRRRKPYRPAGVTSEKWDFPLGSGDLLVMKGETQKRFEHELPARAGVVEERINLTFRRVIARQNILSAHEASAKAASGEPSGPKKGAFRPGI